MTPEQTALVADLRERSRDEFAAGHNNDSVLHGNAADLIEAQAAKLAILRAAMDAYKEISAECATLRAERDAVVEQCAVACDKIAGNTADFSRDHRRAAGQCAAMIRALKGGA